jgi:uncharacterized DUF497 family protein
MKIGYDPLKNAKTLRERGLSFEDVIDLCWDDALIWPDTRFNYGEKRLSALLPDNKGRVHVVCFMLRKDVYWIFSFRKANAREVRKYHEKTTH